MITVVVGAGGHGKVVADALVAAGHVVSGFVDADSARHGAIVLGLPVLGGDDRVEPGWRLANGIGSVGRPDLRIRVAKAFSLRGFRFLDVRHPSAVIGRDVVLGEGSQIMAGAVIQPGTCLGLGVIVNTGALVDHDCRLGDDVHVAPGAVLSGGVSVGARSHIGTGAVVIEGVRIGADCLIAAGAVVVGDVADGQRVAGVPARSLAP